MPEYIDKGVLLRYLTDVWYGVTPTNEEGKELEIAKAQAEVLHNLIDLIEADFPDGLLRCKDCKYFIPERRECMQFSEPQLGLEYHPAVTGYCSQGERNRIPGKPYKEESDGRKD